MPRQITALIAAFAITIAASPVTAAPKTPKLSKCDGKQRRPANPYGTILPSVDPLAGSSTPDDQTPDRPGVNVFPEKAPAPPKPAAPNAKPEAQVPPISGLSLSTSNQSC
jgi:hypothetical protein